MWLSNRVKGRDSLIESKDVTRPIQHDSIEYLIPIRYVLYFMLTCPCFEVICLSNLIGRQGAPGLYRRLVDGSCFWLITERGPYRVVRVVDSPPFMAIWIQRFVFGCPPHRGSPWPALNMTAKCYRTSDIRPGDGLTLLFFHCNSARALFHWLFPLSQNWLMHR